MLSRETRLLLATIAVSAVVVLALSTLRFPDSPRLAEVPPAPLERLAASAAYDQLARIVERVATRVRPDLLVVRSASPVSRPRALGDLLSQPLDVDTARHFPALRIDNTSAVLAAAVPAGAVVLHGETTVEAAVLATDPLRQLTLLEVPAAESTNLQPLTLSELQTPTYVVVAEGTAGGVAFRPVFVGSADRFADARWERPLLAVSGTALTSAGALVFSLEGQFIGAAVVPQSATFAIAGAGELLAAANELASGNTAAPRDFGIRVQALTEPLSRALNAREGVVVVSVDPAGAAAGTLEPLDVITALGGFPVSNPEGLLLRLARTTAPWQLRGLRDGRPMEWTLQDSDAPAPVPERTTAITLDRVSGVGSVVRALPGNHRAARAGLRTGDLVIRAGSTTAPTPAQLLPLLRSESDSVVLIVRRDGHDELIAIPGASAEQ